MQFGIPGYDDLVRDVSLVCHRIDSSTHHGNSTGAINVVTPTPTDEAIAESDDSGCNLGDGGNHILASMSVAAQVHLDADVGIGNPSLSPGMATGTFTRFDDFHSALSLSSHGPYLLT